MKDPLEQAKAAIAALEIALPQLGISGDAMRDVVSLRDAIIKLEAANGGLPTGECVGIYRHFKGKVYRALGVFKDEETGEQFVAYFDPAQPNGTDSRWVRRHSTGATPFTGPHDPNNAAVPRFRLIGQLPHDDSITVKAHASRQLALSRDLREAAKALAGEPGDRCDRCDPSVGHICEACTAEYVMRDAAGYIEVMGPFMLLRADLPSEVTAKATVQNG